MAEQPTKRKLSITEQEIEALKSAFADNEFLLKAVRKLFLGWDITEEEASLIKSTFSDDFVFSAFRKKIYPILDKESPIGELSDYWFGTETEITDKSPDTIRQIVESKDIVRNWLENAFELLKNPSGTKIDVSFNPKEAGKAKGDTFQINLLARNKFIRTVETGLTMIKVIAGQKTESVEQAKKRLEQDSSK